MKMQKSKFALGMVFSVAAVTAMAAVNGVFQNILASGYISSLYSQVTGNNSAITAQGAYKEWNLSGAGQGESDFVNLFGTGTGGFNWYNGFTGATLNKIASLDTSGNLTASQFSGNVVGGTVSSSQFTGPLTGNVNGNANTATQFLLTPTVCAGNTASSGITATGNSICPTLASSLTTSGYTTLANGLIIEWLVGTTTVGGNVRENVTETLPLAFPHACLMAMPGVKLDTGVSGNNEGYGAYLNSCSTTTISAYMDVGADGVGDVNHRLVAFAVGN
jgi:hypothetical protein